MRLVLDNILARYTCKSQPNYQRFPPATRRLLGGAACQYISIGHITATTYIPLPDLLNMAYSWGEGGVPAVALKRFGPS